MCFLGHVWRAAISINASSISSGTGCFCTARRQSTSPRLLPATVGATRSGSKRRRASGRRDKPIRRHCEGQGSWLATPLAGAIGPSGGARPLRRERGPRFLAGPAQAAARGRSCRGWRAPTLQAKPTHPTPTQKRMKKRFRRTGPKISIAGKFLIPIKYRNCIFYSVS